MVRIIVAIALVVIFGQSAKAETIHTVNTSVHPGWVTTAQACGYKAACGATTKQPLLTGYSCGPTGPSVKKYTRFYTYIHPVSGLCESYKLENVPCDPSATRIELGELTFDQGEQCEPRVCPQSGTSAGLQEWYTAESATPPKMNEADCGITPTGAGVCSAAGVCSMTYEYTGENSTYLAGELAGRVSTGSTEEIGGGYYGNQDANGTGPGDLYDINGTAIALDEVNSGISPTHLPDGGIAVDENQVQPDGGAPVGHFVSYHVENGESIPTVVYVYDVTAVESSTNMDQVGAGVEPAPQGEGCDISDPSCVGTFDGMQTQMPLWGEAPTFADSFGLFQVRTRNAPITGALGNFGSAISGAGTCPTAVIAALGFEFVLDFHCLNIGAFESALSLGFLGLWGLAAFRIFGAS